MKTSTQILLQAKLIFFLISTCSGSWEPLLVTSDAPGIRGSNITFTAKLENPVHEQYTIAWQENYPLSRKLRTYFNETTGFASNWTLPYVYAGQFSLTVILTYTVFVIDIPAAQLLYNFEVTKNFTGKLEISQPDAFRKDPSYVSTMNETVLNLNVHDPSKYLETATNVSYTWILNDTIVSITTKPMIHMNFTEETIYPLMVNLTANFNKSGVIETKYGSFTQRISAKVPLSNFTIHGATWFRHGNLLDLSVSCGGSPPYEYCWMIKYGPYNHTGNETCDPTFTTDCDIRVSRYYFHPGTYNLIFILSNDVGRVFNQTGIHVYKTTPKTQMSVIIVPISCTLIAIVLVIFGVAYYWENHVRYNVETADFDFGQREQAPYVRFMDRLYDAISDTMTGRNRRGSPLLIPPDNASTVRYGSINKSLFT